VNSSTIPEHLALRTVLKRHFDRYPLMQIEDAYKLIHQACLGSHHLVSDIAQADAQLTQELATLTDGPPEPTVDPISPDGRIVRVQLRPYVSNGGDPDSLIQAFVRSANEFDGSIDQLRTYWEWFEQDVTSGLLPLAEVPLREFSGRMETLNYPAVHHSEAYRAAYRPAYRVVVLDFLSNIQRQSS
jgi:hypothetical protein